MNDLVINGRICQIDQYHPDTLQIYGAESIKYIQAILENGGRAISSKPGYIAESIYSNGQVHVARDTVYIEVETVTLRMLEQIPEEFEGEAL